MSHILALDLGCTKAIVAIAGGDGTILGRKQIETLVERGSQQAIDRIVVAFRDVGTVAGVDPEAASAIGIGAPGPLDRHAGVLNNPPQMPWGDVALVDRIAAQLGAMPFAIDNDCKVGGVGEWEMGSAAGANTVVYFGVGTGIGGCVIVDGKIQYGASDNASEIGHLVVWMNGPECGCGSLGCLEGIASGSGIERRARAAIRDGRATSMPNNPTGSEITRAAATGDELAAAIWNDALDAMGSACASMMSVLSPEVIVIGGGVAARNGDSYIAEIEHRARARAFGPNALPTQIVAAKLGEDSVLHGAIAMALRAI